MKKTTRTVITAIDGMYLLSTDHVGVILRNRLGLQVKMKIGLRGNNMYSEGRPWKSKAKQSK